MLAAKSTQRRKAYSMSCKAAVDLERAQDERRAGAGMLATDREQQVALRIGELARVAGVRATARRDAC